MLIANRKGNLEVLLDRVAFDGGETINGVVILHAKKALKCQGKQDKDLLLYRKYITRIILLLHILRLLFTALSV